MAGLFGLLGGGGGDPLDIYGDLFTKEQKAALQQRSAGEGLLRMAGAFGQAAQPSRLPTSFMGALGQAAGAMAGHGDEAANTALKGMEVAEKVRQSRAERAILAKAAPFVEAITRQLIGAGVPAAQAAQIAPQIAQAAGGAGAPQAPGAPAFPPGGGDLGGATGTPGTTGDFPTGAASQRPGMPLSPETLGYMQPAPGQPPPGMAPGAERFWPAPTTPDQIQPFPGAQQNTGLLPKPPDQVVDPNGQPLTGPGVLPRLAAGGGAPLPFALASSTPTGSAARPAAGGPRSQAIDYFTKQGWTPAQAAGIAANLEAESSWRKDVPGDGGQAFGYAQWHPPRQENFKRVFGKDIRNATEQEQLAFVNWELNNTEKAAGDRLRSAASPRDAAAIVSKYYERPADAEGNAARRGALAEQIQGGGDYVIPSGRGVPASALRSVADTGAAPGAPAGGGGGFLPGTTVTPEALGALNTMLKMGGMKSDPFGSLLESYYKSPGYIAEAERTRKQAGADVDLKMDPLIVEQRKRAEYKVDMELKPRLEEAVQKLQSPILKEREQAKADIDRVTKQLEQAGAAALKPTDATVMGDDGKPVATRITELELAKRQQARAERVARGDTRMEPGDIVGTPALSPGETVTQQKSAELPYTTKDMEITWPDGETRKVTVTGQQAKDIAEGRPVPEIGWPGSAAGGAAVPADDRPRGGAAVYPPGHAEATTVMLKERRPKAEAAVQSLQFNDVAKQLLDAGVITGTGAGLRLDAAKAASLFGWDSEKIATTEAFLATQARQVASVLGSGAFGSGASITDEDRRQVASMVGANANLDERSLRFLVNLNEKAANWEIDRYEADRQKHDPKGRLPILRVDRPPKAETKANQPTPVGEAALGGKPFVKWSDGKWRPKGELPGEEKR